VEELEEEVMSYTEILIRKIDPTIVVAGAEADIWQALATAIPKTCIKY
jgi:hypothetical protein